MSSNSPRPTESGDPFERRKRLLLRVLSGNFSSSRFPHTWANSRLRGASNSTVAAKMAPITRASSLILGIRVSVAEGPESRKRKTEDTSEKFE